MFNMNRIVASLYLFPEDTRHDLRRPFKLRPRGYSVRSEYNSIQSRKVVMFAVRDKLYLN
jgi:hypothetical protein